MTSARAPLRHWNLSSLLSLGETFTNVPGGTATWSFAGNTNYKSASGSAAITITQAKATIKVDGYTGTYDGHAHGATGTATGVVATEDLSNLLHLGSSFTNVPGGTANWTFDGNTNYETASGSAVITINKATATVTLGGLSQNYNASPRQVTFTTTPSGLTVVLTYSGSLSAPTNAGTYAVVGTVQDNNYQGSATGTLTVDKATPSSPGTTRRTSSTAPPSVQPSSALRPPYSAHLRTLLQPERS